MSDITPAYVAVFKQLGGRVKGNSLSCTGRKGVVYLRTEDGPKPIAVHNKTHKPQVMDCEHEATDLVLEYVDALSSYVANAILAGEDVLLESIPGLDSFFYAYVDEVAEPEVKDLTDAATVIANLMEKS